MTFGERLKELREEKGLTHKQLAQALNNKVSAAAIGHWELGKRVPNMDAVILLARYFNVSLEYICGLED